MSPFIIIFQLALIAMFIITLALLSSAATFKRHILFASKISCIITIIMSAVEIYYFWGISSATIKASPLWFKIEYGATILTGLIFGISVIIDIFKFIEVKSRLNFVIEDIEQLNPKIGTHILKYRSDKDIKAMAYSASTNLFKSPNLTHAQQEIINKDRIRGKRNIYHIILGLMFDNSYSLLEYDFDLWCYCARRYYEYGNSEVNEIIVRHNVGPHFNEYGVFKYIYQNNNNSVGNRNIEVAGENLLK